MKIGTRYALIGWVEIFRENIFILQISIFIWEAKVAASFLVWNADTIRYFVNIRCRFYNNLYFDKFNFVYKKKLYIKLPEFLYFWSSFERTAV